MSVIAKREVQFDARNPAHSDGFSIFFTFIGLINSYRKHFRIIDKQPPTHSKDIFYEPEILLSSI